MPNWAYNRLTLSHKDPAMIERAVAAFKNGEFLQEFIPCPQDLLDTMSGYMGHDTPEQRALEAKEKSNIQKHGYRNWYDWKLANWGTKWDFGDEGEYTVVYESIGSDLLPTVNFSFDTAWSPPIDAYRQLEEQGFIINALYDEESTAFCGEYVTGKGENTIKMEFNSAWARANVPPHIDQAFGIIQRIEEYEED